MVPTGDFEGAAEAIADRTGDLLSAKVHVVDERGVVIASSLRGWEGRSLEPSASGRLEVPLSLEGRSGTIVITPSDPEEVIPPRLAAVLVDLVVRQTTVVDRLPDKYEIKNKFIHDLLHGDFEDEAAILREAQVLGMDLAPPRLVLLIDASTYILGPEQIEDGPPDPRVWQRAQLVIGGVVEFFELPTDTICAYIGNGEVAVLKASNRKNLGRWAADVEVPDTLNPSWANLDAAKRAGTALLTYLRGMTRTPMSMGIGRHHPGLHGLPSSYADARAALSLGRRFAGTNRVHCLDSLGIAAFVGVSDERTKIDLATYLLSPLDHEPDLLQTAIVFLEENCSPVATARRLAIHRNTLGYRLDKIASLTGLDPRRFEEAVQIRLALLLRSMETATDDSASAQ